MKRGRKNNRVSASFDKNYWETLSALAELEHRSPSQQFVHMAEFYLKNQKNIENLKLDKADIIQNKFITEVKPYQHSPEHLIVVDAPKKKSKKWDVGKEP